MQYHFKKPLTGIIYDCDGVMIDSAAGNRHLYNLILDALNLPHITEGQEKFAFQATFHDAIRMLVPKELHHKIEDIVKNSIDYDRDVMSKIKLMPGYREFVEEAQRRGLKQAIDTNRTDFGIQRILDVYHLPHYFDPVMCSTNAARPKPFPDGVNDIIAAWQTEPEQALFVGDSPDDRAAAKGGGAIFAAFGKGDLTGDLKVESWHELAKILWNVDLGEQRERK